MYTTSVSKPVAAKISASMDESATDCCARQWLWTQQPLRKTTPQLVLLRETLEVAQSESEKASKRYAAGVDVAEPHSPESHHSICGILSCFSARDQTSSACLWSTADTKPTFAKHSICWTRHVRTQDSHTVLDIEPLLAHVDTYTQR